MSELANINKFSNAEGGFQAAIKKIYPSFHKYIDGTNQQGRYINENGKIFKVVKNGVPEYYDYPKDAGFVERDVNGNYFYFEPLPAFKVAEIKRLEKLRDDAIAKAEASRKIALEASTRKIAAEKVQADAKRKSTETPTETPETPTETPTVAVPTKKILGLPKTAFWIGTGILALVGGAWAYKKYA
jgi:hypothetical protein